MTVAGRRVLLICADPVGAEMAGLGIRYLELGRVLGAAGAAVTIAHGGSSCGESEAVVLRPYRVHAPDVLRPLIAAADVVVTHPQWPRVSGWLARAPGRVVFDLYDPETLETLELFAGRARAVRRLSAAATVDRLHDALRSGHHFMCASETQRDLWLGAMLGLRVLGPAVYDRDPSLRSVLDVVPFGVPAAPARASGAPGPRGLVGAGREIVLWNGGVWGWLDAETAVRAVSGLAARRPGVCLVFMGASPAGAAARATTAARELARRLGTLDRVVFFAPGWVAYAERADWLLGADCGLCTHRDHMEARFAFRTRVVDCFWAGLPVVCTEGDDLAARVAREDLGAVVAVGDAAAVAGALERVLDRGRTAFSGPLAAAAADHAWPRVAAPLVGWAGAAGPPGPRPGAAPPGSRARLRAAAYRLGGAALLNRRR